MRRGSFRRRFSRRRRGPETWTILNCRSAQNLVSPSPCAGATINAIPVLTVTMPTGPTDPTTAGATVGEKAKVFQGMKFESQWLLDPGTWIDAVECVQCPSNVATFLSIWEMLVVLPLQQGSKTLPAYLPAFPTSNQSFDVADRVLWKRITQLPIWGLQVSSGFPQLTANIRDTNGGQQVVKAKCRIDDRHGLFFCWAIVHDLADPLEGTIPVVHDFWAKMYYRTAFR